MKFPHPRHLDASLEKNEHDRLRDAYLKACIKVGQTRARL